MEVTLPSKNQKRNFVWKATDMSFDQDPGKQAQISGADFAMMCGEMAQLRAENEALKARFRWLEKLFDRKWNGVVGTGSAYRYDLIGPWRHVVQRLAGESLSVAIDDSLAAEIPHTTVVA